MTQRVLVVNRTYPAAGLELLHKNGLETKVLPYMDYDKESLPAIMRNLGDVDGLIWNTSHKLTSEILDCAGPKLKAISTVSSGLDHIDLAEVKRRGLALGHALGTLDDAVADVAVGILIAVARKFKENVRMVENGDWKFGVHWLLGMDISGTTVGIVGFGGVGQAIARRLKGFNVARFLYYGRSDKPEGQLLPKNVRIIMEELWANKKGLAGRMRPAGRRLSIAALDQLLRESDYVILACPLTKETKHLINKDTLALMKKTALLVNIARGGVIDQEALYDALKENRIFGAALDVTTPEPISKEHPLVKLDNCFILPHSGTATFRTRNEMASVAANNIILGLQGKPMECPVKF